MKLFSSLHINTITIIAISIVQTTSHFIFVLYFRMVNDDTFTIQPHSLFSRARVIDVEEENTIFILTTHPLLRIKLQLFSFLIIYLGYVVLIYHDPVRLEPSLEEEFDQGVLDNVELGTTVFLHHLLDADHGAVGCDERLLVISRRGCETGSCPTTPNTTMNRGPHPHSWMSSGFIYSCNKDARYSSLLS